jgi:type III restriction enzyme
MKLHFNADLDYQRDAIASVVDLFEGQETCQTNFTVAKFEIDAQTELYQSDLGIGNRLKLLDEDILKNLNNIQLRNGLSVTTELSDMNFTIEMETGTGKTYVYLRTIFELNRKYGFTKFIIVVPSIAIKEGVYKSLQITKEHFKGLYNNVRYDYFVYDSQKLGDLRNFATSDCVQIMVINIDAFRRSFTDPEREDKANVIHRPHEKMTDGTRPIELLQATNPIVIIDEPQSVDTTDKSREAIASLNPLCTLRYSATHKKRYNQVFRLDAVDAYERKLVKQIEVAGIDVEGSHNRGYIKLIKVDNRRSPITAQVEIDVKGNDGGVQRKKKKVRQGSDLFEVSGGRDVYDGYIIEDIYCEQGSEYISFTSKSDIVRLGEAIGEVNQDDYKRLQIRKTIEEHLDKELRLSSHGIKVLSLFFIDRVANYRDYDEDGNPRPGKYAVWFEEEYRELIRKQKYADLFKSVDRETAAQGVHNGYFAVDKKKDATGAERLKDSRGDGDTAADESAYQLIMRDKEKLLSFDSKLKFIFSHSALKEGWDNPNVFQICTLNETSSEIKRRQEIGRGLRIAVNQDGERVHGFDVNTLTVMANESYEDFARKLQREIEEDTGIRFGIVEKHLFAGIPVETGDHIPKHLGVEASEELWQHLKECGYIDAKGKIQDKLRSDIKTRELQLPESFKQHTEAIRSALTKVAGSLNIKNAAERARVRLNKAVYLGTEFKELWDRIKSRTTFRVDFDPDKLIHACAEEIKNSLVVGRARFVFRRSQAEINRGGVMMGDALEQSYTYEATDFALPDIVSFLQNETNLTRRSIVDILQRSGKFDHFKRNPQKFIEQTVGIIQHQMRLFIVDGIRYQKIGDEDYYAQELFETEELYGYLSKNMLESQKSVFSHIVYDSEVEAEFARSFELSQDVKVYAKLPSWFKIETPLGSYNPDWAVLVERDGKSRLFFVVESKGGLFTDALRPVEQAKIACGKAHFKALETDVHFRVSTNFAAFDETIDAEVEVVRSYGTVLPFRRINRDKAIPYQNCVPLLDLKAAAGGFSPTQAVDVADYEWAEPTGRHKPSPSLFIAQVVGESMNRRIPNGAWCLWRLNPSGTRQGKVVLAQHRKLEDPELGGTYTVKVYHSEKVAQGEDSWKHSRIVLKPDSTNSTFQPIIFETAEDGELTVVAELVEVLGVAEESYDVAMNFG